MKRIHILPLALLMLIGSCTSKDVKSSTGKADSTASNTPSEVVELSKDQIKNADIELGKPETREMFSIMKVNGVIDLPPENIITVSIPMSGYLKKTTMVPGTKVSKGTLLAVLEDQQYIQLQQDYLTAKSKLEFVELDFNRQKTLNETKSVSDKIYQQAKTDYESQKILVKALAEKLRLIGISPENLNESNISRMIQVTSPINGYVTKVNVNIGKYVNPSDEIFELIDPSDLHVRLTIFENDAANLSIGQKLVFATNNKPDQKYRASIHLITPNIEEDRTTSVHCHMEGFDKRLLPGTFINATIEMNNAKVTAVPEDAIVKWNNKPHVFVEEAENKFSLVPVEIGTTTNSFVEIKTTLPNKKIVTKNAYTVLMKLKNSGEEG